MSVPGDGWPDDPQERLTRLAHDLRTPLAVVKGFAELLATRPDIPATDRAEFVDRVLASAIELQEILDAERASRPLER